MAGAFVDGSGLNPVADILRKDGYAVSIVQYLGTSMADDVAATKRILDVQSGREPQNQPLRKELHDDSSCCFSIPQARSRRSKGVETMRRTLDREPTRPKDGYSQSFVPTGN